MPRNKKKTVTQHKKAPMFLGGAPGLEYDRMQPKDLPWWAQTAEKPTKQPEYKTISSKTMVEWNTAGWIKRLIAVCAKLKTPVIDPVFMEHTPLGTLVMQWKIGNKIFDVLVLERDTLGSIALSTDDGEEIATSLADGWSQGAVDTEDQIEKVWRWLINYDWQNDTFLQELLSVATKE